MYNLCHNIQIGSYKLGLIDSVEIKKSVDLLADTATIVIPGLVYNQSLDYEKYLHVGDTVKVQLGYDDDLKTEFEGYVQSIDTDDNSLSIQCQDAMYLTQKPVGDKEFSKTTLKQIASYCLHEIGLSAIDCTHDVNYEKYIIHQLNAFDVFKKLKADTSAHLYMIGTTLHIHPPYKERGGDVVYDFAKNIESSDLKYRNADDRKYEVEINCMGLDGIKKRVVVGTSGAERRTIAVNNPMDEAALKKRGETELSCLQFSGYEGSITGWLIPFVEPTFGAKIVDKDYEYKQGTYYVKAVTTNFSNSGGVRKIELGRKLG